MSDVNLENIESVLQGICSTLETMSLNTSVDLERIGDSLEATNSVLREIVTALKELNCIQAQP